MSFDSQSDGRVGARLEKALKKKLVITLGDRGGTGKTTVARLLWEWLRTKPDACAYDADGTTGAFAQVYARYDPDGVLFRPQPPDGVTPILLHAEDREGRDAALETLMATDARTVLVDMHATSLTVLERVESDWSLFAALDDAGWQVVTINVVTPYASSLQNVLRTLRLAPRAESVVVLNEAFGRRDAFFLWDGDGTPSRGKALLAERGGAEIVLPALPTRQSVLLDAQNLPFGIAARVGSLPLVSDVSYVHRWLRACREAFEPAAEVIGLPSPMEAVGAA